MSDDVQMATKAREAGLHDVANRILTLVAERDDAREAWGHRNAQAIEALGRNAVNIARVEHALALLREACDELTARGDLDRYQSDLVGRIETAVGKAAPLQAGAASSAETP
jgi:hypothetical protein